MQALTDAMTWLGQQPDTLFLGQGVGCPGTRISASFDGVPAEKRLEMPVAEELQLGISIGLALEGSVPISVFPRINFLWRAADQLINHLDKLPLYSGYRPKVIIRTAIGQKLPLDAGPQHTGDCTTSLTRVLETVQIHRLLTPQSFPEMQRHLTSKALEAYQSAYARLESTLIVEY